MPDRTYHISTYAGGGFGVFEDTDPTAYTEDLGRFEDERYAKLFINALELFDAGSPIGEGTGLWEDDN